MAAPTVTHGWRPETGFIPYRWQGYDEGLLLYLLGLGSPTHPLPAESYAAYTSTYQWKSIYGWELLYSGPLFTHQLSHMWVDFRGIRDAFMRAPRQRLFREQPARDLRAARIRHPQSAGLHRLRRILLGVHRLRRAGLGQARRSTGSSGSSSTTSRAARRSDRTTARSRLGWWWLRCRSRPEIVVPTARNFARMDLGMTRLYGFKPSFNLTFPDADGPDRRWVTPYHFGIDQGPVVLMIENYRTELLWKLMRRCRPLVRRAAAGRLQRRLAGVSA